MQKIKVYGGKLIMMDLPCPKCGVTGSVTVLRFIQAINQKSRWHCSDCGCNFGVEITSSTRDAQLRNEAVDAGQVPLVAKGELVQMVNSLGNIVIDSFSKKYVSGNDLDFANDCLDKVIPLLPGT